MQQALQLDPSHLEANLELARAYVDVGLGFNAKPLLERVLQRAPEHQQARRLMAKLA
jgi:FimV-like protein